MDFYQLHTLGDLKYNYELYYRANGTPDEMGMQDFYLTIGERAAPYYPAKARICTDQDPRFKGTALTSLLGNVHSLLIVCSAMKDVIASFCQNIEVEYFSFDLYDKKMLLNKYDKKTIVSKDYFIINPIGTWDCLDEEASGITYGEDGDIIHVARYIINNKKTANLPHLLRPQGSSCKYIVSEYLAKALEEGNFSNVQLELLNQV